MPTVVWVKAKPRAKEARVRQVDGTHFEVWVREAPEKGRANDAVLEALAGFLGVPRSRLALRSGRGSRTKRVEVL
jgi:hypothetical protein